MTTTTERHGTTDAAQIAAHPLQSIAGTIGAYFLIRVAARTSYGVLTTYLGREITGSATVAAVIATVFYISEIGLAPVFGNLSDRHGRKPYLILSPIAGGIAALVFALITLIPGVSGQHTGSEIALLAVVFGVGRFFEGIAAASATPAGLGFLADVTDGDEKRRARVMTAFELMTVLGFGLGIPVSSFLYGQVGVRAFFAVAVIYLVTAVLLFFFMRESRVAHPAAPPVPAAGAHGAGFSRETLRTYRELLGNVRLAAFVPAWLAVNAMLAAFIGLIQFVLNLPTASSGRLRPGQVDADVRFPEQLLYGGYDQPGIIRILGIFVVVLLVGMVVWAFIMPRIGRANTMRLAIAGLAVEVIALAFVNRLADNPQSLTADDTSLLAGLLPVVAVGVFLGSGFAPAALTHLAAISAEEPERRGAVMGLYSLLLGGGQLLGTWVGGAFVDFAGFNGLLVFAFALVLAAGWSVQVALSHLDDRPTATGRAPAH